MVCAQLLCFAYFQSWYLIWWTAVCTQCPFPLTKQTNNKSSNYQRFGIKILSSFPPTMFPRQWVSAVLFKTEAGLPVALAGLLLRNSVEESSVIKQTTLKTKALPVLIFFKENKCQKCKGSVKKIKDYFELVYIIIWYLIWKVCVNTARFIWVHMKFLDRKFYIKNVINKWHVCSSWYILFDLHLAIIDTV